MYAGVDFGTSNCSIGVWKDNGPVLIPLEGKSTKLPSALYTDREEEIYIEEIDPIQLSKRVAIAKRAETEELKKANKEGWIFKRSSHAELENRERGIMRRELAERAEKRYKSQTISKALYADTELAFGDAAILRHIQDPQDGYFIKSPKSFIGAELKPHHIELFSAVIMKILDFIKTSAENNIQSEIDDIVLGHPVNFHGPRGQEGNIQALDILERAARAAGFKNVEFLMEPIAAALDFERSLSTNLIALVLDAGGGTTDCSMIKLGPSYIHLSERNDSVLGYAGDRVGGTDLDIKLALRKIMPYFGKDSLLNNGLPIPTTLFWNAIAINDVNAQARFLAGSTGLEIASYLAQSTDKKTLQRLQHLHKNKLTIRLHRSAELAKIHLSDRDPINLPLRYIEPELVIALSRHDLKESIQHELNVFLSLMKDVERQAGVKPNVIYVTGGTAKSPIVEEWIRSHYRNAEIVVGDAFGSVASGLTTWAHRIYHM